MSTALLIIDVQQALCTGEWAAFDIDNVIVRINRLGRAARAADVPVVFVQHESMDAPLRHGSPGWQLATGLEIAPEDLAVRKTTSNSFHQTDLHALLQARGVDRLVVCGLQTEFCVDTTVRQALALGYEVVLAADAHSTLDSETLTAVQIRTHHNRTLRYLDSFATKVVVLPAQDIPFRP